LVSTEIDPNTRMELEGQSQSPWRVFWFPQSKGGGNSLHRWAVAIPLAGLLVSTASCVERNVVELEMSQSPWRVFWFPLTIRKNILSLKPLHRNPLGGSFGFHIFLMNQKVMMVLVAIPLAGLLVSTNYTKEYTFIKASSSQSPWRVFWFPHISYEPESNDGFSRNPLGGSFGFHGLKDKLYGLNVKVSQSPWRVFWFPLSYLDKLILSGYSVAIPLAGLLVST